MAYLRERETYADLACGFGIGTSTVHRYIREAIKFAARKAFVILDGTLLRIDRIGMDSGRDRPYCSDCYLPRPERAGQCRPGRPADVDLTGVSPAPAMTWAPPGSTGSPTL